MDLRRSCRTEEWYFGQGDDTRATVRWFFAAAGASVFANPTPFRSLDFWDGRSPCADRPGPVKEPRFGAYNKGARPGPLLGHHGVCGPASVWASGSPSPPVNLRFAAPEIPDCCVNVTSSHGEAHGDSSASGRSDANPIFLEASGLPFGFQAPGGPLDLIGVSPWQGLYYVVGEYSGPGSAVSWNFSPHPSPPHVIGQWFSGNLASILFWWSGSSPPRLFVTSTPAWGRMQFQSCAFGNVDLNSLDILAAATGAGSPMSVGPTAISSTPFELWIWLGASNSPINVAQPPGWITDLGGPAFDAGLNLLSAYHLSVLRESHTDTRITTPASPSWISVIVSFSTVPAAIGQGTAHGSSTAAAIGSSTASGAGLAAGDSTAAAAGNAVLAGTGLAAGDSTAAAVGNAVVAGTGLAAGDSTAAAVGNAVLAGTGLAAGSSTASAIGQTIIAGTGLAAGSSTASAIGSSTAAGTGLAAGDSTANARAVVTPLPFNATGVAIGNDPSWGINFPVATTAGNTLVVAIAAQRNGVGTGDVPNAWPGGWTLGPNIIASTAGVGVSIFYAENAASITGISGFDFAANADGVIFCCELPNVPGSSVADGSDTRVANSAGTAWGSGTLAAGAIHRATVSIVAMTAAKTLGASAPTTALFGPLVGGGGANVRALLAYQQQFSSATTSMLGSAAPGPAAQFGVATQCFKAAT